MLQVDAPEPEWFSTWFDSPYYHLPYRSRNYTEAGTFIKALLMPLPPEPGAYLLDLACGKGRDALLLSERGYEATGPYLSAISIAAARRHFHVHDMRNPLPYGSFNLVLNLFTSFGYFQDESENVVTLRNATAALQPGGKMVINFLNTERAIRELVAHEHKTVQGVTFHLHRHLARNFIVEQIRFQAPGAGIIITRSGFGPSASSGSRTTFTWPACG